MRNGRRLLLLKQGLRFPLPQAVLHEDVTHLGEGDEKGHGVAVVAQALQPAVGGPVIFSGQNSPVISWE